MYAVLSQIDCSALNSEMRIDSVVIQPCPKRMSEGNICFHLAHLDSRSSGLPIRKQFQALLKRDTEAIIQSNLHSKKVYGIMYV